MSGNTESTSKSTKFAPMPMATLLANLMPLQKETCSDVSFTSADEDESDDSTGETVANKPAPLKNSNKEFLTPVVKGQPKETVFISEKKINYQDINKENWDWSAKNQTHPSKDRRVNVIKSENKETSYPGSDLKKRNILTPRTDNIKYANLVHKKTPEIHVQVHGSVQKTKTITPVIKPGIRKFTPGSASKSQKKTPQKLITQRDRVRCELFTQNQSKDEPCPPVLQQSTNNTSVPETPLNKKPIPATYVATPSYPQGVLGNASKVSFKTITMKDKKYMFIKKLGIGGSSEVYKVNIYPY